MKIRRRRVQKLIAVSIVIEECKIESNIDRASPGVGRIKRINFLLNSSRFDPLLHRVKRAFIYFLHLSFRELIKNDNFINLKSLFDKRRS